MIQKIKPQKIKKIKLASKNKAAPKISVKEVAAMVSGQIQGDPASIICGAAPFENAAQDDVALAGSAKYLKKIAETSASTLIISKKFFESNKITTSKNLIIVDNPPVAFAKILGFFFQEKRPSYFTGGISSDARMGDNFEYGTSIQIAPFVVIGKNVKLGNNVVLYPNVVIGDDVVMGNDVLIYPNVTIYNRTIIGSRIIIHAGTVIGSDGFGFAPDGKKYHKIQHTGIVRIDDDVEIGANNTIDRAVFDQTWIKKGVKTDNLVHLAHNITVGENSVIVAQVGVSGSTTIGKNAVIAGQAGIGGHLNVGDNVTIGPRAGVTRSIDSGKVVSGMPEMPHRLWLRVSALLPQLPQINKRLLKIEKILTNLKKSTKEIK